ncbi:hypothetical protein [Carboxylicivirga sp. M1479]|uniref:hypothetical protein n=1 Tax=Carboxylicivirga sp. M1479 TaxID=2594476 RepID=UPI0011779F80|nr:hypothetical protein [Carboxylicivirga sp. M1479]TRX72086.1 hypothetical protein FNN09_03530 [Carboxylicivirga sp. M1479]
MVTCYQDEMFLSSPSWQEELAIGKGVGGDSKSEGSHQQSHSSNVEKLDIRLKWNQLKLDNVKLHFHYYVLKLVAKTWFSLSL